MERIYHNPAAHNDARNADRTPAMSEEAAAAAQHLERAMPFLVDWHREMNALREADPSALSTKELKRLTRVAAIVADAVNEARAHTAEARRISRAQYSEQVEDGH